MHSYYKFYMRREDGHWWVLFLPQDPHACTFPSLFVYSCSSVRGWCRQVDDPSSGTMILHRRPSAPRTGPQMLSRTNSEADILSALRSRRSSSPSIHNSSQDSSPSSPTVTSQSSVLGGADPRGSSLLRSGPLVEEIQSSDAELSLQQRRQSFRQSQQYSQAQASALQMMLTQHDSLVSEDASSLDSQASEWDSGLGQRRRSLAGEDFGSLQELLSRIPLQEEGEEEGVGEAQSQQERSRQSVEEDSESAMVLDTPVVPDPDSTQIVEEQAPSKSDMDSTSTSSTSSLPQTAVSPHVSDTTTSERVHSPSTDSNSSPAVCLVLPHLVFHSLKTRT